MIPPPFDLRNFLMAPVTADGPLFLGQFVPFSLHKSYKEHYNHESTKTFFFHFCNKIDDSNSAPNAVFEKINLSNLLSHR